MDAAEICVLTGILRNAGLIKAHPGKNGGYVLAKSPADITVRQIMDAFDSDLKHSRQQMKNKRNQSETVSKVRMMHSAVMESLNGYLNCITVQDLLDATEEGKTADELIADSLEKEVARLRS